MHGLVYHIILYISYSFIALEKIKENKRILILYFEIEEELMTLKRRNLKLSIMGRGREKRLQSALGYNQQPLSETKKIENQKKKLQKTYKCNYN